MKLSEINDYIQTLATIGAIFGLVFVGLELQLSNRIAARQTSADANALWQSHFNSIRESGLRKTLAKAMLHPDELTLDELLELDAYYGDWVGLHMANIEGIELLIGADNPDIEKRLAVVEGSAPYVFDSRFGRAWVDENDDWIPAAILEAIEKGLENQPHDTQLKYVELVQKKALAM
jgi:hypothetical protein